MAADRPAFPWWDKYRESEEEPSRRAAEELKDTFEATFSNPDAIAIEPGEGKLQNVSRVLGMRLRDFETAGLNIPEVMQQFLDFLSISSKDKQMYSTYVIMAEEGQVEGETAYSLNIVRTNPDHIPISPYSQWPMEAYFEFMPTDPFGSKFKIIGPQDTEDYLNSELMTTVRLELVDQMVGILNAGFDLGAKTLTPDQLGYKTGPQAGGATGVISLQ